MIDPNYPANSIAWFLAVVQEEVVSLCPGVGGVLRQLEGEGEVLTLTLSVEEGETWAVAEEHIVPPSALAGVFFDRVDTLVVVLYEWRSDKRYLVEGM
jgi:hypothetical protein